MEGKWEKNGIERKMAEERNKVMMKNGMEGRTVIERRMGEESNGIKHERRMEWKERRD